jgi:hypothetical protein
MPVSVQIARRHPYCLWPTHPAQQRSGQYAPHGMPAPPQVESAAQTPSMHLVTCREPVFYAILRRMIDVEERLELAGETEAVARVQENENAWIQGRYQKWVQSRPAEAAPLMTLQLYQ